MTKSVGHWWKFRAAENDLKQFSNRVVSNNVKLTIVFMATVFASGERFYVPDAASALTDYIYDEGTFELPYDAVNILSETTLDGVATWKMTLVLSPRFPSFVNALKEIPLEDANTVKCIFTSITFSPEIKKWVPQPLVIWLRSVPNERGFILNFSADAGTQEILDGLKKNGMSGDVIMKEFSDDAQSIINLIGLCRVSNSRAHRVAVPEKLRKNTVNNLPLYDYHVLSINNEIWDSPHVTTGTGSGKRTHFRRGHVRRLGAKIVWVRNTIVHGSRPGFSDKEYSL